MGAGLRPQEESQGEARSATERMVAAQAELARALQRVQQLAAETGASPDLPPASDPDAQVGTIISRLGFGLGLGGLDPKRLKPFRQQHTHCAGTALCAEA